MIDIRVSEINIIPVKPKKGLLAFCSFVINDALYIRDIAIYNSLNSKYGYRLVYPARKLPSGDNINVLHPISREADEAILKEVVKEFERVIDKLRDHKPVKREGGLSYGKESYSTRK